jgi:pyruvate ferredoxin oxidoreductase gamma subunit
MKEVRWHGRGGQGSFTIARLLGSAAVIHEGKHALAFPSFGPERRGAPVLGFTRISNEKIKDRSEVRACDYVVVLDETLIDSHTNKGLRDGGKIIINTKNTQKYIDLFGDVVYGLDATHLALEHIGRPITNTAMMGALIAVSEIVGLDSALKSVESEMKPSIAEKNKIVMNEAYKLVKGAL